MAKEECNVVVSADGAAAPEDDALAGGLADGGVVGRRLRQVRVRRRARAVLPLQPRRDYIR